MAATMIRGDHMAIFAKHRLTIEQKNRLQKIRAKLDPDQEPRPPSQGDYVDDVPFLLGLIAAAYANPVRG